MSARAHWSICAGLVLAAIATPDPGQAEVVVARHTIRAQTVLQADDLAVRPTHSPGAATDPQALVGMETRQILYAGQPILTSQVGPPALVERNAVVTMVYAVGGVEIRTYGRALGRAGHGETLRVMNLGSRATVSAQVAGPGIVIVSGQGD